MAVAPITVEMGPRNKRRVTTSAITITTVFVIVASVLWFFGGLPFTHNSQTGSTVQPRHLTLLTDKLVYGMSRQQVQGRIGAPTKVAGGCWEYPENKMNFVGQKINAIRVCFLGNAYSNNYEEIDGKWRVPGSSRIVIAPPSQ
jgi:hypothetical protein